MKNRFNKKIAQLLILFFCISIHGLSEASSVSLTVGNGTPGGSVSCNLGFQEAEGIASFCLELNFSSGVMLSANLSGFARNDAFFPALTVGGQEINFTEKVADIDKIYFVGLMPSQTSGPVLIGRLPLAISSSAQIDDQQVVTLSGQIYTDDGLVVDLAPVSKTVKAVNIVPGDIDGNGIVDLEDARLAYQVLSKIVPAQSVNLEADIDGDGEIGKAEINYIMQVVSQQR